jgi:maltooligosyltrehalose synthase
VLDYFYWREGGYTIVSNMTPNMRAFLNKMWHFFYKEPVDNLSDSWEDNKDMLKARFFDAKWNEVYDFIEFTANNYPDESRNTQFMKTCNEVLEAELSAYRFVGNKITKITSETEISEIEEALRTPLKTVNTHLENALNLMSDRKSPDHRNSIKESISAVEALCRLIASDKDATLGKALDIIEKESKIELHGALKKAFDSLYGCASTAGGIRHAFSEDKVSVGFEDAKFMLVSCSTFVNYLIVKASKAGIKLA